MERSNTVSVGTNVYSQDGAKIGDVSEVGDDYLLVQKGWLFVTDRYVPMSAIERSDADGIYLNVTESRLDSMDWSAPPAAGTSRTAATTGSGYAATDVADETIYAKPPTHTAATPAAATTTADSTMLDQAGEVKIPVVEEELRVGKREVEGGGVQVTTRIDEVPVNEQVTLHEETVNVQRQPVDRPVTDADRSAFQSGTFEVRERSEEAVVDKQARIVEEVHIKKDASERTETVQDTVRRTDVDVEQLAGDTRTSSTENIGRIGAQGVTGRDGAEGTLERGASKAENAAERATGSDLNRDGDVGQRDTRNNF